MKQKNRQKKKRERRKELKDKVFHHDLILRLTYRDLVAIFRKELNTSIFQYIYHSKINKSTHSRKKKKIMKKKVVITFRTLA